MKKKLEGQNMVTVQKAADAKGVSPERVYQWIAEGRISQKRDKVFNRVLVDLNEVLKIEPLKRGPKKKGA